MKLKCNVSFMFLSRSEPRAADHEEAGPLQHSPPALLLLLQWRQGQLPECASCYSSSACLRFVLMPHCNFSLSKSDVSGEFGQSKESGILKVLI